MTELPACLSRAFTLSMSGVHVSDDSLPFRVRRLTFDYHRRSSHPLGVVHRASSLEGTVGVATPRFLFVNGVSRDGVPVPAWPDRYTAAVGEVGAEGQWIAWRLAGPNNRELGRSAALFPDQEACLKGVAEFRADLPQYTQQISLNHVTGLWGWRLAANGLPVAVSGRGHQRRRECEYNLERFLATAAIAMPATVRPSTRRHPRGAA